MTWLESYIGQTIPQGNIWTGCKEGPVSFLGVPFTAKNIIPHPLVLLKSFQYDLSMVTEHREGEIRVERA